MNLNILQTLVHSCFCVQAKDNYGWPSLATTALAGRLVFVLLCFLKGETRQSTSLSILIYGAKAADMGE